MRTVVLFSLLMFGIGIICQAQSGELKLDYDKNPKISQVIKKAPDGKSFEIKLTVKDAEFEKDLKISSFSVEAYQNLIVSSLPEKIFSSEKEKDILKEYLKNSVLDILIWTFNELDQEGPKVGELNFANKIIVYTKSVNKNIKGNKGKKKTIPSEIKMKIVDVNFEVRDGFIEQIAVRCKEKEDSKQIITFSNNHGIGFSTIKNFRNLRNHNLNSEDIIHYNENNEIHAYDNAHIKLSDVFSYQYEIRPETKEYTPGNGIIGYSNDKPVILHRAKSSEIVSGTFFTDFTGLREDKPNGLLETEFYKRINILTNRWSLGYRLNASLGIFQYIRPTLSITKVEENNRDLILRGHEKDQAIINPQNPINSTILRETRNTTPIELLNHQILALGFDLNLIQIDARSLKSEFYLNYGFRYRKMNAIDSLTKLDTNFIATPSGFIDPIKVNALSNQLEIIGRIMPEERYGFHIGAAIQHLSCPTTDFELRPATPDKTYFGEQNGRFIWTMELGAFLKTGENRNDKFFLRWRFNWEQKNAFNNFAQLQFGYSIPFTKQNK